MQNKKVVLVTGGSQGLGKAICKELAEDHIVIIGDIQDAKAVKLAEDIQENNGEAYPLHLDVSKEDNVQEAFQEIIDKYSRLDVLINNAGVDFTKAITEMSVAEWDVVMSVNLRGPFITSK